jgi:hypothetical protein
MSTPTSAHTAVKKRTPMGRVKSAALLVAAISTMFAAACAPMQAGSPVQTVAAPTITVANPLAATPITRVAVVSPDSANAEAAPATAPATTIRLGDAIVVEGAGAQVAGNTVTITAGGTYRITGTLSDGQIVVAANDSDKVQMILDGAGITSSSSAPIYVKNAKNVAIVLADGSQNYLVDSATRIADASGSDEPNAALATGRSGWRVGTTTASPARTISRLRVRTSP